MGSIITLGVLVLVAMFLGIMLLKRSPSSGTPQQPSMFSAPAPAPVPVVEDKHAEAVAIMADWYREAKRKEFEDSVLKDVVEKFSAKRTV